MPYILDRDGLEYYHRRRKWLLFGDLYDVTFTGDYNVNQTTIAKLKVKKQSSEVQADTNDMEFPDVYCEAEVTPDTDYTAGEATVTREGNLFIVDVDNANIRLVTLTIDPTPMGSINLSFTLPDGTTQYVQTSTSETVTVQLPAGSMIGNKILPPYEGYSLYVNGIQTDRIKSYVISEDQTLSIVYQPIEYDISVYFVDQTNNAPLVVSWTAEITNPETGVVTTTTGTSSHANIPAPVGAQYKVTGVPPTGYTSTRPSVSGKVPARDVQITIPFTQMPKKQVTITTGSTYVMEGASVSNNTYTIQGLVGNDEIEVTFPNTGYTEVGEHDNVATYEIISDSDAREAGYDGYEVTMIYGTITITEPPTPPPPPTPPTP